MFDIRTSHVEVDSSIMGPTSQKQAAAISVSATSTTATTPAPTFSSTSSKEKKIALNSGDKLLSQLRGVNFAVVVLNRIAKRINEDYEVYFIK